MSARAVALWLLAAIVSNPAWGQSPPLKQNAVSFYNGTVMQVIRSRMQALSEHPKTGGMAIVRLTVQPSGLVTGSQLLQGSGSEEVDQAALGIVPAGFKVPPFPAGMSLTSMTFDVPLRFNAQRVARP